MCNTILMLSKREQVALAFIQGLAANSERAGNPFSDNAMEWALGRADAFLQISEAK